jgi:hypothetical protein
MMYLLMASLSFFESDMPTLQTSWLEIERPRELEMMTHRPANVPQRHANQATHARYAAHARAFFLGDFVSVENKGSKIQLPKLKVASSSLVARSISLAIPGLSKSSSNTRSSTGCAFRIVATYRTLLV